MIVLALEVTGDHDLLRHTAMHGSLDLGGKVMSFAERDVATKKEVHIDPVNGSRITMWRMEADTACRSRVPGLRPDPW